MRGVGSELPPPPPSRVRLRAPDDIKPESAPPAPSAWRGDAQGPQTREQPAVLQQVGPVPHLDIGSPDYIEERLENLKRRPTWANYLDRYVETFADDDDEEAEPELRRYYDRLARYRLAARSKNPSGLVVSLMWSTLALGLSPILLLAYPFLRRKGLGFWPMGCSSMGHLLSRSVGNLVFLLLGVLLLYWAICRELPELDGESVLVQLDAHAAQLLDAGFTCQSAALELDASLARQLCTGVGIDTVFVVASTWLVARCHRRWARYAMLAMAVAFFLDAPAKIYDATFPAPTIKRIDPTYAMVDEEITIAVDGQNLKPGGSVAWVSYWGCATTSDVAACEKQFSAVFSMGVVHVTFKAIDHFIPCYRDPPNPLKAQEYVCFLDVRVRVKDKQSIPGWSKIQQPTPAPYIGAASNAVPSKVSDVPVRKSNRHSMAKTQEYHERQDEDEPAAAFAVTKAIPDDSSDCNDEDLESADRDVQSTHDQLDDFDDSSQEKHHGLDSSINTDQPTPTEDRYELKDARIYDQELHQSNDPRSFGDDDDDMTNVAVGVQATFDVLHFEKKDNEMESVSAKRVDVEALASIKVKELHHVQEQQGEETAAAVVLVEMEVAAADPSSLTLGTDEALSSEASATDKLEPVIPPQQLLASEDAASSEVKAMPPHETETKAVPKEKKGAGMKTQGDSKKKPSRAVSDGMQAKSAVVSVVHTTAEVESIDEHIQATGVTRVETAQLDTAPLERRAETPELASGRGIKAEVEAPEDPVQPLRDCLEPTTSEEAHCDRRREDDRAFPSVSSIRVDRRESYGQPARPSRQSPSPR